MLSNLIGILLGFNWNPIGIQLDSYGILLESYLDPIGIYLEFYWKSIGIVLESIRILLESYWKNPVGIDWSLSPTDLPRNPLESHNASSILEYS